MSVRLPPFSGLTAFYAAVRHGTLSAAAQELNVSQPAVSRRIAALEQDLGCRLFDRSHRPVRLTPEGRDLAQALRAGFGQIETAVERLRMGHDHGVITVSGPSGFVGSWLIPKLAELEQAFPELTIRLISQEYGEPERPGDVALRFGLPDRDAAQEVRVLGNEVYPVASPLYLQRQGAGRDVSCFDGLTLLTMEHARRHWHDWPSWFETQGQQMPAKVRLMDFNSYAMMVNAALAAHGVCLCWSGLLDDFLSSGAVVRLGTAQARSERGYYLSLREGLAARPEAVAVRQWILDRAQQSV
ncbi:LysR family transcriptional regulator [Epibacterium sp. SM1969]|uniref:LysR family transcriptional regulator n=2 Tax=Tritonibacter aquimaris TaxID=2663379 RepID=A0A844AXC8_9RHOB|nr:LysR family transcriptional regulator [Tritonibacter aquimaris]